MICTIEILKIPKSNGAAERVPPKVRVCGPQMSRAKDSKKMDTPIVEISGAKCDTFLRRKGRSAKTSNK